MTVAIIALAGAGCGEPGSSARRTSDVDGQTDRAVDHAAGFGVIPASLLADPAWRFYLKDESRVIDVEGFGGRRVWAVRDGVSVDIIVTTSPPDEGRIATSRVISENVTPYGMDIIEGLFSREGTSQKLPYARLVLPSTVVYVKFLGDEVHFLPLLDALEPVSEDEWLAWISALPKPTIR